MSPGPVALALGSNLGNRLENLRSAVKSVEKAGWRVTRKSDVFETEPWGVADQPHFLNACILADCALDPETQLLRVKQIEREMGRTTTRRWGERTLDIDIILIGERCYRSPQLEIPHVAMQDRCFVLLPLAQVCPDWVHPQLKRTVAAMAQSCPEATRICAL